MMDILEFIFRDGWTFFGTLLLIVVTLNGIVEIFKAIRRG